MLQLDASSDENDSIASGAENEPFDLKDLQAAEEETRKKIEKRADLLAEVLQTVISVRRPFSKASDPAKAKAVKSNDPFRKN